MNGKCRILVRYASALLYGRNITKDLKTGKIIKLTCRDIANASMYYDELEAFITAVTRSTELPTPGAWYERLAAGWYAMRHDRDYGVMFDKIGISKFCQAVKADLSLFPNGANDCKDNWFYVLKEALEKIRPYVKAHFGISC